MNYCALLILEYQNLAALHPDARATVMSISK